MPSAQSIQKITAGEFYHFCNNSNNKLLKTTYDRPKLLETTQGDIIKIFYAKKKKWSSSKSNPYAIRFCKNAELLRRKGIHSPLIKSIKHCPELNVYLVCYEKLSGVDTRILSLQNNHAIIYDIANYMSDLHKKGIFFRSIHLENILYDENNGFALLDIVDVQFKNKPLNFHMRYRNLKHLFSIKEDKPFWKSFGKTSFIYSYLKAAKLPYFSQKLLSISMALFV